MEQTSTKSIQLYNARDLHQVFTRLYEEQFQQAYQVKSFIGYEMKGLKNLLDKYDAWSILCAIRTCIKSHSSSVTVHYVISDAKSHIPDSHAELRWMVGEYGTPEIKEKFREFLFGTSRWFPSSSQNKKQQELLESIKEWVHEEEKQKGWVDKTSKI